MVRVWRLADGAPVGEPLDRPHGGVEAVAVGALPDGTPVIVSGGGGIHGTVRVWRLADGAPVGEPLRGHDGGVEAVAAGALPDGTPVIVSGGSDGTVRVWRLADGTPVGEPLRGHDGGVEAVAVGALPDGTPVIVSGGSDGTVRVWRLADGTPLVPPLDLPERYRVSPFTATSSSLRAGPTSLSTSQRSRDPRASWCSISRTRTARRSDWIMAYCPVHQAAMPGEDLGTGILPRVRLGHVIRYIGRGSGGEGAGTAQARRHERSKALI